MIPSATCHVFDASSFVRPTLVHPVRSFPLKRSILEVGEIALSSAANETWLANATMADVIVRKRRNGVCITALESEDRGIKSRRSERALAVRKLITSRSIGR